MTNAIVRIESIEVKNFKNVGYGYLDFENTKKEYKSVCTGRTALVRPRLLTRWSCCGSRFPAGPFRNISRITSMWRAITRP